MNQKIYSDRTELEGVDLPTAGQTKMLVIDENKKLKSEPKPVSDVEPITGTIPLRYGLGEGRIKVGNGIFEKDAVNRSQLDALAVGRIRVESWKISLDKSQINNLHTTPISVLWSDMGLDNNHVVRWRPELTAVKIDDDGTPFFGSSPIHVGRFPIQGVISIHPTRYGVSGIYSAFPVQNSVHVGVEPEFYIETGGEITGGGVKAKIEIMLFYEIDTVIF